MIASAALSLRMHPPPAPPAVRVGVCPRGPMWPAPHAVRASVGLPGRSLAHRMVAHRRLQEGVLSDHRAPAGHLPSVPYLGARRACLDINLRHRACQKLFRDTAHRPYRWVGRQRHWER